MNVACRCSQQPGGLSNIGSGASPNAIEGVWSAPPSTYPGGDITSPKSCTALLTGGAVSGVAGVAPAVAEVLHRRVDGRVRERDLVVDPLCVRVLSGGGQHDVLDPVGRRPAGRRPALEPDTPRRRAR